MSLDVFDLTSRQSLAKTSGIVLDRDSLPVFQSIEQHSTRSNLTKAMLFTASSEKLAHLKITRERFLEVIKDLIEFKLVAQIFEVVYTPETARLELETYFLTETESLRDTSQSYEFFLERSAKEIYKFCKEKSIADPKSMHRVAHGLSSGNARSFGSKFQYLFGKGSFLVIPPDSFIKQYKSDLRALLEKYNDIIGDIDSSLYFVPEQIADDILLSFRSEFEAKLLPVYRLKDEELDAKIQSLEDEESIKEKKLDYKGDWEFIRKLCSACLEFPKILGESGRVLAHTIVKLSILAENFHTKKDKAERDGIAFQYVKEMNAGLDIDSLFPRVNLEAEDSMPKNVVDALRVDRDILHAEWFTPKYKLIVFARKSPETLTTINQMIYDQYRTNTEYALYFRALLESNEKDVYEVFQKSDFVNTYGKNLQSSYLRYIPFIYKIFAWLGIRSLTNAGYAKAKSIIKYNQMERQFQFEKRAEKLNKEKMEKRVEELAKKELEKFRNFLINALEDFYFLENTIPTAEDIGNQYPALIPMMLEKVCKEFKFGVVENGGYAGGNLIFFPATDDWDEKNRGISSLIHSILTGIQSTKPEVKDRAKLLEKALP